MHLVAAVAAAAALAVGAAASGLEQIEHVVLFMQENRAFDHYFGTMAGVRGFGDPNAHPGVFNQPVDDSVKPKPPHGVDHLSPWYLGGAGGDWAHRAQCMIAGDNSWKRNQDAWNNGALDRWARGNTPYSIGFFRRDDIPIQFSLAESFTVADAYYESIIGPSDTNRAVWFSGTINSPGSPVGGNPRRNGGPLVEDRRMPGCSTDVHGNPRSCLPMKWKTVPEYLLENGISFRVYQELDNMFHDTLDQWAQYGHGTLKHNGTGHPGLSQFYDDAKAGTLPAVSYIVTPANVCEHPPFMPRDGGWIQRQIAEAVMTSPKYRNTALIISYDETGGWADHVMAPHAPKSEPGEWMQDPFSKDRGLAPTGPGFRVPFYIVSPWTRSGGVFTEPSSHESQILFLEEWAKAHGKPFHVREMNSWRRKHMSNLVNAFDFAHPDDSHPHLPEVAQASRDPLTQDFNGAIVCLAKHLGKVAPPVPYTDNSDDFRNIEHGAKRVRGHLSEGRFLVFEAWGHALTYAHGKLHTTHAAPHHDGQHTAFVLHWQGSAPNDFSFKLATPSRHFLTHDLALTDNEDDGVVVGIYDLGNGAGHQIEHDGRKLSVDRDGNVAWKRDDAGTFEIYSVSN